MDIIKIENQLKSLFSQDKKNWVQIYLLIKEVDEGNLWKENFTSFTRWVRHLSEICHVHESLIWTRNKAGKVYHEYQDRMNEKKQTVPDISEINVSPDNLVLIEKIAQGNTHVEDDLIDKVLQKELTRSDLKSAWATVKAEKEAKGINPTRKNAHESYEKTTSDKEASKVKASDIVLALQNSNWILENIEQRSHYIRQVYEVMSEFPVRTGTSRHARRIDALVLENINTPNPTDDIVLHGVEIKVDKHDLLKDKKTSEYEDFVDYLYLAIPSELLEYASRVAKDTWGIITYDSEKKSLKIVKKAIKKQAVFRDKTIATALIKKMKLL